MAPEQQQQQQQQQQPGKRKRTNDNSGSGNISNGNDDNIGDTNTTTTNNNNDDENLDVIFGRVADRRRKEVTTLEPAFVRALLLEIRSLTGIQFEILSAARAATGTPIDTEKAGDEIRELIMKQYRIISDEDVTSNLRRRSWDVVREIFRLIGDHGGTSTENNDHHQRKKVKYTGRNNIISASTANNSAVQSTATTAAPKSTSQNSARVSASTSTETSRPQGSTSNREDNNGTNSDANGSTKITAQTHPSMTKNKTANSGNNEINSSNSSGRSRSNSLKNNIRTVASLSAASASTTAVAIDSSNSTPAVHPSMVRKSSSTTSPTTITAVPPPYQKRSATVLDNRNISQNRSTSGGNAAKNKKHPPAAMNRSSSGVRNRENNNVPVHPSMNRTTTTTTPTGSSANNSVRSTTAPTTAASASTAFNAVSASSSSSSSSPTSSPRQGTVANNTTAIPETVLSNKSNTISRPKEKPKTETAVTTLQLPADNIRGNSFAGYINIRPYVTVDFHRYLPTANMRNELGKRLLKWDPYWKVEKMLCTGLTAPVTKRRYQRNEDTPPSDHIVTSNTAATFKIDQLLKMVGPRLRQVTQGQPPKDCELRVLLRMVPLDLSAKQSEKRADVHIWPKGTYLQVHAAPSKSSKPMVQKLIQRKQQSHDLSYWAGICHPLDLTSLLHSSWSSTSASLSSFPYSVIECGCHDSEVYEFSLALCMYQSPQTITKGLLTKNSKTLKRLSLTESYDRAIKMMKNNEVTLDDSDDEDNKNNGHQKKNPSTEELKRIQFSLKDPLAMTVIKTPVRGSECKHFSVRFCIRFPTVCYRCRNITHFESHFIYLTYRIMNMNFNTIIEINRFF
jgi:hypothetical protein